MASIGVLIADDEELIRQALRWVINAAIDVSVLGEARDGAEAIEASARLVPDVVLMDLRMPGVSGLEAIGRIRSAQPSVKTLVVSTFAEEHNIVMALRAGANGFIVKDSSPDIVLDSIRDVHRGEVVLSPSIAHEVVESIRGISTKVERLTSYLYGDQSTTLTARELSIVRLLAEGLSNAEIGSRLHLSESTVKANLRRIMRKWAARDRIQVLIRAIKEGIVSP